MREYSPDPFNFFLPEHSKQLPYNFCSKNSKKSVSYHPSFGMTKTQDIRDPFAKRNPFQPSDKQPVMMVTMVTALPVQYVQLILIRPSGQKMSPPRLTVCCVLANTPPVAWLDKLPVTPGLEVTCIRISILILWHGPNITDIMPVRTL